ncbi:hypothetical protein J6590_098452 [Homalodisca vitripennis]|nr:hypothetical protein J6590_098452 [Homalodisca vitripennis]
MTSLPQIPLISLSQQSGRGSTDLSPACQHMSGRKALIPCKISGTNKTIRRTIRAGPSPGGDWQLADGRAKFAHPACNEPPHWSPGHAPFNAATRLPPISIRESWKCLSQIQTYSIEFVCILGRRSRYEHFSGSFTRYEECAQVLTTTTTGDVQDMNISQALLHGMKNVHKFSQQQQRSGILKYIWFVCILGRRSRYEHFSGSFTRYEECAQVLTTATTVDAQDMNTSQAHLHGMKNVQKFSQQQQRSGILKYIGFVYIIGRNIVFYRNPGGKGRINANIEFRSSYVQNIRLLHRTVLWDRVSQHRSVETMQGVRIELFRSSSPTSFEFLQMNMIPAERMNKYLKTQTMDTELNNEQSTLFQPVLLDSTLVGHR